MWKNNIPKYDSKTPTMEICVTPKDDFFSELHGHEKKLSLDQKPAENQRAPAVSCACKTFL